MRLTAEILQRAEQYLNACKEREINLRGYKIPAIENISVIQDQFDVIDLSDNEIKRLDNFPTMTRLSTLLLSNNYIIKIGAIGECLKGLQSLVLTNNRIASFAEIDNLGRVSSLQNLCLLENPVAQQAHYRFYVIHRIPTLKSLDFRKVEAKEREAAAQFFAGADGSSVLGAVSTARVGDSAKGGVATLTEHQKQQVRAAIEAASTREEIDRIEKQLKSGTFVFTDVAVDMGVTSESSL